MRTDALIGVAVDYFGEPAEIARPALARWTLADGRSGVTAALYLPRSERIVQHARICTAGGRLTVVHLPELDGVVLDARPVPLRGRGGAA